MIKMRILSDLEVITPKQKEKGIVINPVTTKITIYKKNKKFRGSNFYQRKYVTSHTTVDNEVTQGIISTMKTHIMKNLNTVKARSLSNITYKKSANKYERIFLEKNRKERIKTQV